jgi:hypothetical protein
MKNIIEIDDLRSVLHYDPETGALTWRERDASMFRHTRIKPSSLAMAWNKKFAGNPAFVQVNRDGYLTGTIFNKPAMAHQIIWAMVYGEWSTAKHPIDHINRNRSDNRLINLRRVDSVGNAENRVRKAYKGGNARGVSFIKATGKWQASARLASNKHKYVGVFSIRDEAIAARDAAECTIAGEL